MFKAKIVGEKQVRTLHVKTTIYRDAVAAVPALFGKSLPIDVDIWYPPHPDKSYRYRIRENEFGGIVVEHLVRQS